LFCFVVFIAVIGIRAAPQPVKARADRHQGLITTSMNIQMCYGDLCFERWCGSGNGIIEKNYKTVTLRYNFHDNTLEHGHHGNQWEVAAKCKPVPGQRRYDPGREGNFRFECKFKSYLEWIFFK